MMKTTAIKNDLLSHDLWSMELERQLNERYPQFVFTCPSLGRVISHTQNSEQPSIGEGVAPPLWGCFKENTFIALLVSKWSTCLGIRLPNSITEFSV